MSHIIPSPLSFKSISNLFFKREYSTLIAAPGWSLIACKVWKSQKHRHLQPPLLMLHVWKFLSASPVVIFEYLFSAPPIRAHQSEWEANSPPTAGRCALTQHSYSSRLVFRQRLSKTHLPWPHNTRHNGFASHLMSRLFYMNALSLLGKKGK